MNEHIVKAFSEELGELNASITRMGGLVERALNDALKAVASRDDDLAVQVIARDEEIDELQRIVERQIIRLLALRQPMAKDLRQTLAGLKIASDLERIGDLAKNIAKRARTIMDFEPSAILRSIDRMGKLAAQSLKQVLDAFSSHAVGQAVSVWLQDEELDAYYNSLFRELLTYMMEDPRQIGPGAHMLFIAKNLERIGDHCTNISEVVHYLETGEELVGVRPKLENVAGQE